jgi:hypothetical protein
MKINKKKLAFAFSFILYEIGLWFAIVWVEERVWGITPETFGHPIFYNNLITEWWITISIAPVALFGLYIITKLFWHWLNDSLDAYMAASKI